MAESILFVDDDCMVLNALERTFFETEFTTYFALNATDGYKILADNKIDIVISDIRMLPVSGTDFLKKVSILYPDAIRAVLSAYGDRTIMIKIICEGLAQVYILKPWDNATLINQVRHLISMYRSLSSLKASLAFPLDKHLPSPPSLYAKMLKMVDENRGLKDIATLIETDPASTANVLRLANSSFYGITIGSVHQALVYMGISTVKDIVLVSELFNIPGAITSHDLRSTISNHMVVTSKLLHGLHQHLLATRIPDEFSVAGLLADIGRLFLTEYAPDKYRAVIESFKNDASRPIEQLEATMIGFTHTQLGGLILDWWNLPASLVESSLYHHTFPFQSFILPEKIIALLGIADAYAWHMVEKTSTVSFSDDLLTLFSVTRKQLDDLVTAITDRIDFR